MEQQNTMGPAMGGEMSGQSSSKGPTIGAAIVVIILIIGAIYVFWQKPATAPVDENNSTASSTMNGENLGQTTDDQAAATGDVSDLEFEASSQTPDDLSSDLKAIDTDLQQP